MKHIDIIFIFIGLLYLIRSGCQIKTTQEIKEPSCEWNLTPDI